MIKPNKSYFFRNQISIHAAHGFSLIEFLVASVLSMIVLIAVGSGYFVSRKLNDTALARLSVQQDLRNASNMIVRDARMAGSFGCFNMSLYDKTAVNEADFNDAMRLISAEGSLVPVKFIPAENFPFNINSFTPSSGVLVFQYGIGSASISPNAGIALQIPEGDPLQTVGNSTPLVFSSCAVLDHPSSYTVARNDNSITISNISPALSAGQVPAELSVLRYIVNAYVVGTVPGGQQGLFRFQLNDNGQWSDPQLLIPNISVMNIQYGYVNNCAVGSTAAGETFSFVDNLDTSANAGSPALIRIRLDQNNLAATTAAGTSAGNVFAYNIDATIRGGNTCADRSI